MPGGRGCGPQRALTNPALFLPVEPAPPILVVALTEKILKVNATYELPHCMPSLNLMYEVDFWKEATGNKVGISFPAL